MSLKRSCISNREQPLESFALVKAGGDHMPPEDLDATLTALPLRIGVYIPDDLMEDWFAPGTGMNPVSDAALEAAESYGRRFECEFKYYPERMEGVFWKWVPAI
jgi:hypothetical protein